ncbi:MAG TPA: phage/plasmid primase, P4 family [Pirellulales bacterium]|jgi:putative DNA primase/helicase|nr:phage/plasmid primase, P4 family [Pirellulales bacterium]
MNVPDNGSSEPQHVPGLLPHHQLHLYQSGLTAATIRAAGIHSETKPDNVAALLGWRKGNKKMVPALVFPFRAADGTNGYARIKPDRPMTLGGKPAKYLSPKGKPNQIYFPPGVVDVLQRPEVELLLTEGEKKALKANQEGFLCLGLVGVFGWKDGKSERLLPALEQIAWKGRPVRLVFDSDITGNEKVQGAESRLAQRLTDLGAVVRVVRLPDGPPGGDGKPTKMGLDDFLVAHGPGELRKLLDAAQEPEPLSAAEMKESAQKIDPCEETEAYLQHLEFDGVPRLRFWNDEWFLWRGGCYRKIQPAEVRADVIRRINRTHCGLTTSITNNCIDQLRAQSLLPGRVEVPAWIDEPPIDWPADELLAARNCLIHLPSLVAGLADRDSPATPRYFTTAALDYDFDFEAPAPTAWLDFLGQLWPQDPASVETLQDWFGYCLTPDTCQQKIQLLVGPPRSGKGTIARVLAALIGKANVAGPTLAGLATNFGLWPLIGKSLAIISDARLSGRTDSAIVTERLLSISGEDAQTIDRKNLPPITCKLPTRLMILTNELPRLPDASGAFASRLVLLRLTENFLGREDKGLTQRLIAERPGILLWAIEGWRRLRERGRFVQPESGGELLANMHDLSSPIGQFIAERCLVGPYRATVEDLFAAWRKWCEEKGRRDAGTEQTFGRDLLAAQPSLRRSRPRRDGERCRVYDGIGLMID